MTPGAFKLRGGCETQGICDHECIGGAVIGRRGLCHRAQVPVAAPTVIVHCVSKDVQSKSRGERTGAARGDASVSVWW